MKSKVKIIFIFIMFFITFSYSKDLQKVTLQLQWLDQFQFAGYYIAKEKGFYKDVDLDVKIQKFSNDIDIVDDIAKNKTDFATGRTSLLIHKNRGVPIVALAAIFQHSPAALLVTNEDILRPSDLINKRVMITTDAITSASYMSMLFSEGIINENLIVQKHSFNVNDLVEGKTDAMASYISNEPYKLDKMGIKYKYFHPKDYGFDFYGDLLFTSQENLDKNPKRVEEFTKASLKGWKYAFDNIEESAKIIYEKYNSQNKSLEQLIYEGKVLKDLALDKNKEIGHIDKNKFDDIAKTYRLLGLLKKEYSLNNFIYEIHCTDKTNLNNQEISWLREKRIINLGTNKEWNPIEFFENKKHGGIASGYLELLEKKLNLNFNIKKDKYWNEMIEDTKNDDIDMFLAMVKTPQREQYLNFTKAYLSFPTIIVTRDNIGYIKDMKQLFGKRIAIEKGFYTNDFLEKYKNDLEIIEVATSKEALTKVYEGTAFAYIGALPTTGYFIKELNYTNLKINGEAPFKTDISFATRKELKTLHKVLEKTLEEISPQEHDEIYNKWVNIVYEKKIDYTIIVLIVTIFLLIALTLYFRNRSLQIISETDTLTNIANRRKIDSFLDIEIERSKRNSLELCIVLIDIDFFKKVNDKYGHKAGDKVLKKLAKILKSNIRRYDLTGRWGGEEFILICPNSTLSQTIKLSKKLTKLVENTKLKELKGDKITISCGVAQYNYKDISDDFIYKADYELYKAKENGRNCVYPKI